MASLDFGVGIHWWCARKVDLASDTTVIQYLAAAQVLSSTPKPKPIEIMDEYLANHTTVVFCSFYCMASSKKLFETRIMVVK